MPKEDGKGTLVVTYREDEGEVDRRRLAGMMGAATTVLMLFLIVALSLGMVGAALGVGMGGFVASFGEVEVEDIDGGAIYPVLGEQPACEEAPQLMANLEGSAEINEHVAFYKDLPLPGDFDEADIARINIVSDDIADGDVQVDNLELRLSALAAGSLDLDAEGTGEDIDISEFSEAVDNESEGGSAEDSYAVDGGEPQTLTADELSDNTEFGIGLPAGTDVVIDDGLAAAHQVSFESITLPDVDLFITMGEEGDFETETNVEERAVQPDERVCDALADASGPDSYDGDYPSFD